MTIDPNALAQTATLTFADDFDSFQTWNGAAGLDTTGGPQWAGRVTSAGTMPYNNELEWYVAAAGGTPAAAGPASPFSVAGGVLSITARRSDPAQQAAVHGQSYTSGLITTDHAFSQTYGYFEMRAQMPAGQGLWPAFWLLATDGSWPPEIDVMEMLGHQPTVLHTTVHSQVGGQDELSPTHYQTTAAVSVADMSAGFHTYGVDWEPTTITWYFDGREVFQAATPADLNKPMYMVANLAVGGDWPGSPDASTPFPATMKIDYIRAYEAQPSCFAVDGSRGVQTLVGSGSPSFIGTAAAAGSGTVLVDLRDGYVAKGLQPDATLQNIEGVQLGADPSVVLGLASGTDLLYGGAGDDQFYGQGAADDIQGGTGTNEVVGGTGNEVFYGRGGTDTMRGGTARNFMQAGPTAGSTDVFYGNGGTDAVYGGPGSTDLFGGSGRESLTGGSGFNQLVGSARSVSALNIFNGGTGTDVFQAGIGTNLFYEGTGTDVLVGSAGTDFVYGGGGRSFIHGGAGTDVITTGAGDQYVQAGSGKTVFSDTAANLHAGRFDAIEAFAGGLGTELYLPAAVQGATSFVQRNAGTAVLIAVGGGTAEILAGGADLATVQAHTHFTL